MYTTIQAWRATACLLVVLFHISINMARESYFGEFARPLKFVFEFGGNAGVAFFFVLSGFIISHAHRNEANRPEKLPKYIKKRLIRIYPTYWVIFLIALTLSTLSPPSSWQVPDDSSILLSAFLLCPTTTESIKVFLSPILSVAWTLRFELVFYAFFGLFFISKPFFIFACSALGLFATYNLVSESERIGAAAVASSHFILLFLMGVGSAGYVKHLARKKTSRKTFYLGGIIFAATAVLFDFRQGELDRALSDIAFGLSSALLIAGSLLLEMHGNWRTRFPQYYLNIGDASYAIYLLHYPLVALICKIGAKHLPINAIGVAVTFSLAVVASISVGVLFHKWLEAPMLEKLNKAS